MPEAGYSGTPLPRKLGIREDSLLLVEGPPAPVAPGDDAAELMAALPGLRAAGPAELTGGGLDVIVLFSTAREHLAARFGPLAAALAPAGGLWVAYPKKAAKVPTDLDFGVVQGIGLEAGLVDNKSCAVSHIWSGVRFVIRLADRPGRA
jgi:hypothetical protein